MKSITACTVVSAILFTGHEAATQNIIENVDDWSIVSVSQPYNEIDPLCILRSPSIGGTFLQISNPLYKKSSGRGNALFFIYTPKIVSDKNKEDLSSQISVDGKIKWDTNLHWNNVKEQQNAISGIIDDQVDRVIQSLSAAKVLMLTIKNEKGNEDSFSIDLRGSSQALSTYEACLKKVRIAPD